MNIEQITIEILKIFICCPKHNNNTKITKIGKLYNMLMAKGLKSTLSHNRTTLDNWISV